MLFLHSYKVFSLEQTLLVVASRAISTFYIEDTSIMSHTKEGIIQIVVPLCADVECNTHTSSFGSTDIALVSATVDSALEDVDQ